MKIISNCKLCGDNALHVIGEEGSMQTQQCISCGYASSDKFKGKMEENKVFDTLPEEMRGWAIQGDDRVWIPSLITLPFGTIYPTNVDGEMKWAFALMVDIPEGERKNYPIEGQEGKFYKQKYDLDNQEVFDQFLYAMAKMNEIAKSKGVEESKIKMPKLKRQ